MFSAGNLFGGQDNNLRPIRVFANGIAQEFRLLRGRPEVRSVKQRLIGQRSERRHEPGYGVVAGLAELIKEMSLSH